MSIYTLIDGTSAEQADKRTQFHHSLASSVIDDPCLQRIDLVSEP